MFGPLSLKQLYLKSSCNMSEIITVTLNPAVDRELSVAAIEYDRVLRALDWRVDFGGKGFNVSRMLKSLGTDSIALGFAGGKSGEILKDGLESLGIRTDFVWVTGETRTNVSIVTEDLDHYIKVNEPGPTISVPEQEALFVKVANLAQPESWWVLAGSLPPGIPPDFYYHLINIIQTTGAKVILDTSGDALVHGCQAAPYLIKPNEVELKMLANMEITDHSHLLTAALSLQSAGIPNILVSMGKKGAYLKTEQDAYFIKSPSIQERNPIGAGDSMVGGIVWGLSQNLAIEEAARWGVACGAAAASLSGTAVGSYHLVKELFTQTILEAAIL